MFKMYKICNREGLRKQKLKGQPWASDWHQNCLGKMCSDEILRRRLESRQSAPVTQEVLLVASSACSPTVPRTKKCAKNKTWVRSVMRQLRARSFVSKRMSYDLRAKCVRDNSTSRETGRMTKPCSIQSTHKSDGREYFLQIENHNNGEFQLQDPQDPGRNSHSGCLIDLSVDPYWPFLIQLIFCGFPALWSTAQR